MLTFYFCIHKIWQEIIPSFRKHPQKKGLDGFCSGFRLGLDLASAGPGLVSDLTMAVLTTQKYKKNKHLHELTFTSMLK